MIRNYFKVALRYLLRNKGYTSINILGLAVGIASCILIMLFVRSEFSYDRFHKKSGRIYRAWLHEKYTGQEFLNTQTPIPLGPALQENISDVESYCRVFSFNTLVQYGEDKFNEPVNMVDSSFFSLFDFGLAQGNRNTALAGNHSLVISEKLARKYFGSENPIGKSLDLRLGDDQVLFTISAVSKECPKESSIQFDILIPHSNETHMFSDAVRTRGWTNVFEETYVLLKKGKTGQDAESKIPDLVKKISGDDYVAGQYNIHFQPITNIHLNKSLPAGNLPISDPAYAYILGTIGILILLIACINFITLSVGRSVTRSMEVGVRKVLGAERKQLIRQFWGEALLLTFVSLLIGIALSIVFLTPFNQLANKELVLRFDLFTVTFFLLMTVVIGLIAGVYPAIVLSGFNPVQVLKNRLQGAVGIGFFRRALITGQFTASILMIMGTLIVGKQLNFLQHKNLGYDREHVIIVATNKPRSEGFPLAEKFKAELMKNPRVSSSATSIYSFSEPTWITLGYEDKDRQYRNLAMNAIDADFIPSMKLELVKGRNFSPENPADMYSTMIVNESLVKEYGWDEPIGKTLPGRMSQTVIGVVRDFNFESLHNKIRPLALVMRPDSLIRSVNDIGFVYAPQPRVSIRLRKGDLQEQIASVEQNWKSVAGSQDFDYRFLDESLNSQYQSEMRLNSIVRLASLLSIWIACMGLFGLVTLAVVRRTKEIGIRKVMGAGTGSVVFLLSKDFIWLITIAALIAFPVAWWALNKWLQEFAYRINIAWWYFVIAGGAALAIALITVSFQSIKAALTNPVKSLRTE